VPLRQVRERRSRLISRDGMGGSVMIPMAKVWVWEFSSSLAVAAVGAGIWFDSKAPTISMQFR
jgi:hypothetical protein